MSLLRITFLLLVASFVNATPWVKHNQMISFRDDSANCGTLTITVTSTIAASGQQAVSSGTVTVTSAVSSVTTISGGTSQLTCFSSATTLAPAPQTPKNRKRQLQGYKVYEIIEDIDCSCDGKPPHTETSFSTSYFGAGVTSSLGSCSSATATTTLTTTGATVGAITTTITTTLVSTSTASPSAVTLASQPQGLNYYFYAGQTYMTPQVNFVNTTELPFLVNKLSNKSNFTHSGNCANINALKITSPNDADPTIHLGEVQTITMPDGYQAHGNMFGIIFQGYLYAASGAGTYQIQSSNPELDDVGLVWLGNNALANNWNQGNPSYQIILSQPTQQTSVHLAAGEAVPLTIFYANVDGPGQASFNVVTPDGTVHTDTTGYFVGGCGNSGFMP